MHVGSRGRSARLLQHAVVRIVRLVVQACLRGKSIRWRTQSGSLERELSQISLPLPSPPDSVGPSFFLPSGFLQAVDPLPRLPRSDEVDDPLRNDALNVSHVFVSLIGNMFRTKPSRQCRS